MKYLQKLAGGIDTTLALHALLRQPELWIEDQVILRSEVKGEFENWFSLDLLPQFRQFIFGIMARIEGEALKQVNIMRVPAGGKVTVKGHSEIYFLAVNVLPGVSIQSYEEGVMLAPGDVWWVQDSGKFVNNSADDFIVLLVWATPSSPATYVPEPSL